MKLSLIIHLSQHSTLHWRHLLNTLPSQEEVLLYHAPQVELPDDLPDHWHIVSTPNGVQDAWQKGLKKATGNYVAFFEHVVSLHPEHFNLCIDALTDGSDDAVFTQADYINSCFLSEPFHLPILQPGDLPGFLFQSALHWPIECFVFRKSALQAFPFGDTSELPRVAQLLPWAKDHAYQCLPVATVEAAFQEHWKRAEDKFLKRLLADYALESLLPSYARGSQSGLSETVQAQRFILQGLRNHSALELFRKKQFAYQNAPPTAILSTREANPPAFFWSSHQNHETVHISLEDASVPFQEPLMVFDQREGVPQVKLYGFNRPERYTELYEDDALEKILTQLLLTYRPERVHFLDIKPFGFSLLNSLAKSNYPVYLSITQKNFIQLREDLKHPQQFEQKYTRDPEGHFKFFSDRNRDFERLVSQKLAALLVYREEELQQLVNQGYTQATLVKTAIALQKLYQKPLSLPAPEYPDAFGVLYAQSTQATIGQHLSEDMGLIAKTARVLCVGELNLSMVSHLSEQKIWSQGVVFDEPTASKAQARGLSVYHGKLNALSSHVHYFDCLHIAYVFETLTAEEIRLLLGGVVMALKKGGQLILRGFHPSAHAQLNVNPDYKRAYAPEFMRQLLEYVGFEVLTQESSEGPLADYRIEARLKVNAVPQSALPIASSALESYWQEQIPPLELQDDQRVLLMGTHIHKSWLIYRVQCAYLLGVTLNFGEMGKRLKASDKYHFRHTRNPLNTLKHMKTRFDVVALQGVFENHSLKEAKALLKVCHQLLNEGGSLYVQSLKAESFFGHGLLHLRPAEGMQSILAETGFLCKRIDAGHEHLFYTLQKIEPVAPAEPTGLSDFVEKAVTPLWASFAGDHPLQMNQPKILTPQTYTAVHAHQVLEKLPAGHLEAYCLHLIESLKAHGFLVLSGRIQRPDSSNEAYIEQLVSHDLISYLLQSHGMRQHNLEVGEEDWIWYGFRSVQHLPSSPPPLSIQWKGDILNYHSLATVNRELLNSWLSEAKADVSILSYSDPAFEPQPGEPFYRLGQIMHKPLLSPPDLLISHHWPPDFELPDSGAHWIFIQPWEFGSLPEHWIYHMNKFVDQVWVPTEFVKQSYLDSGLLEDKVAVVPNGVDTDLYHPDTPPLILDTDKKFKFLYVGGAIIRKGLDLLLKSYFETFSNDDDVCLVIKEFGTGLVYQGIDMEATLAMYRDNHENPPEVLRLNIDLPPEQMPALYNACDAFTHPYRGEGFALPIAEAMACEMPVIVTGFGACLDFCNEDNAFLIPAEKMFFEEKKVDDYTTVDYPYWADPDTDVLSAYLRHVYENPENARGMAEKARQTICENFTWQHAALRMDKQIQEVMKRPVFRIYRDHALGEVLETGFSGIENQNYEVAIAAFEKALQIDPYQPSVLYNLGIAYLMLKAYEKSLSALTRSMREGSVTGDLCYAMGTVLRHLGDQKTSQQFFARAQELSPELFSIGV